MAVSSTTPVMPRVIVCCRWRRCTSKKPDIDAAFTRSMRLITQSTATISSSSSDPALKRIPLGTLSPPPSGVARSPEKSPESPSHLLPAWPSRARGSGRSAQRRTVSIAHTARIKTSTYTVTVITAAVYVEREDSIAACAAARPIRQRPPRRRARPQTGGRQLHEWGQQRQRADGGRQGEKHVVDGVDWAAGKITLQRDLPNISLAHIAIKSVERRLHFGFRDHFGWNRPEES